MRKIIAALQVSLDGYIEGPNGELDWAMAEDEGSWKDILKFMESVDACLLGRRMYPGYEEYWMAVLANPDGPLPLSGQPATKNEITYARLADKIPHYVVSKTLDKVKWKTTRIIRDLEEVRAMKQRPGKNIYVVGGATLVSGLMNAGLLDEVRVMVNPLVLGGGKPLFKDVKERRALRLIETKQTPSGKVNLTYATQSVPSAIGARG